VADAAVAAGGARPPGIVAAGHGALQLIHVADEIPLAAVECLLELLELGAPALDPVLSELDVGFELGLPLLQVALEALQLDDSLRRGPAASVCAPRNGAKEVACSAEISTRRTIGLGAVGS
jgi:hypothetical protein